jgi:hypothetical protein
MTTTVTGLDRLSGITDPGGVAGDDERHPDPGGARAGTLTDVHRAAQQEILPSYDAAPDGEKGAILHREDLSRIGRELTPWAATRTGHAIRPTPFSGS